jgi:hypothetical protein
MNARKVNAPELLGLRFVRLWESDGQPAPYPSLAVRARNGRVADDAGVIAEYWGVYQLLSPLLGLIESATPYTVSESNSRSQGFTPVLEEFAPHREFATSL